MVQGEWAGMQNNSRRRNLTSTMEPIQIFTKDNFQRFCDLLAEKSCDIKSMINRFGYPSMLKRRKDFEGLVKIILEQQVSLGSALAVLTKLKAAVGNVTPQTVAGMDDDLFRHCGFSRQKQRYVLILADEILKRGLDLESLSDLDDNTVRQRLTAITGIGLWSCDVYLLMCLNRMDIFPATDLALVKSMKENNLVPATAGKADIEETAKKYQPYRSILAMILWHAYIKKRGIKIG